MIKATDKMVKAACSVVAAVVSESNGEYNEDHNLYLQEDEAREVLEAALAVASMDDTERLTFIEAHPTWLRCSKGYWSCKPENCSEYPVFKTAREAIGWAMQEYGA